MRFKGLDLNLLVVFDTLMQTHSVSRTAETLHVSQPAISAALRRLRIYFGDEILVVDGRRMFPTAFAESLIPRVRASLSAVDGVLATSAQFDPLTSHRTFRLCGSDYIATALLAPLARRLANDAPNIRLEIQLTDETSLAQLEQGAIDVVFTPEGYLAPDLPAIHVMDERHVVAGWRDNPLLGAPIGEEDFLQSNFVEVLIGRDRTAGFSTRHLKRLGKVTRVDVVAPSFAMVPWFLVGTMRLAVMHERLARIMALSQPITFVALPFDFPEMREMLQIHPSRGDDAGISWLLDCIATEANS